MKLDILKIINLVGVAMSAVEKIKGAHGPDKQAAVIEAVNENVPVVEGILGIDFVNDPALRALLANYVDARKALENGVASVKALKPQPAS